MKFYRDIGAVLYPVLGDTSTLARNMSQLLQGRAQAGGSYRPDANGPVKPFGMSLGFLSLLFAVLASGCQLSDLKVHDRELTSWVYSRSPELVGDAANRSSILLVSVPPNDELCLAADG